MASANGQLRAGIVGAGPMGRWHAQAAARAGSIVAAVVDPNPEAQARLVAKHGRAATFASIEQMLDRTNLDVLHVCTPPGAHNYIAEVAIDAGINLVIEKPLTPTAMEAEHLFDLAEKRRVIICPVHQFLFQDGVISARRSMARIGRLVHMEGTFCSAGGTGKSDALVETIAGEILPHPLALMHSFLPGGLPQGSWVTVRTGTGELRAMSEAMGVSLAIFVSMRARPTVCEFKLVGTEGTIHLDMFHGFSLLEQGRVSKATKITRPFGFGLGKLKGAAINLGRRAVRREFAYPGLQPLIASFYAAVGAGTPAPISREDAIRVATVRDSILDYARFDNALNWKGRAQCL
jgi:predicted dehydrogenase